ncbi:MAG: hypothetical protein IKO90_03140 [Bacteroidales bacterium]|nr:hypothetical protein [Bacteroidales bacterium]
MKIIRTFIKIAIASLFCIITMTSCSELSLSETELKFPAGFFETKSFVVKTDLNWDIVEQPDWVKTDKIEENGRTIVEVMPKVNNSFDSRKGEIKIQTSEKYYIVDLIQDGVHLNNESGDLGLSVEWNTCNLGATKSTDFGNYYRWDDIHSYPSNGYRLPTNDEQVELRDNSVWVWGENNGVRGTYFVAKNGNYVFLPAAGYRDGTDVSSGSVGSYGFYWSSSASDGYDANGLFFSSNYVAAYYDYDRCYGRSVRLVRDAK